MISTLTNVLMALLLMLYQVLITQYYYMNTLIVSAWLTVLSQINLHLSDIVLPRLTTRTVSVS